MKCISIGYCNMATVNGSWEQQSEMTFGKTANGVIGRKDKASEVAAD